MKKLLMAITIASVFAACKSDSKTDLQTNKVMLTDTTGIYKNNMSSDTGTALQRGERPVAVSKNHSSAESGREKTRTSTATSKSGGNTASTGNTTTTTTTTRRKGWSSRAKGAVIGGAAGAIGGAIISKHNKGTGAVIGGVAGAAGGYIIGNEIDKKNKR